jgi:hypothetical protein
MISRCLILAFVLAGCGPTVPNEHVQRIEVRQSGWQSLDVAVTRTGIGSFEQSGNGARQRTGTFRINPHDFDKIEAGFAQFHKEAVPVTDASLQEMGNRRCPEGVPYVTDNGAIYVRWVGEGFDQHYLAHLGCDQKRNANRNATLSASVRDLILLIPQP